MRFNFHGKANAGTITIQANASAFSTSSGQASNVIEIVVPVPFIPQTISFTQPTTMTVKDKDQTVNATSTSGLPVVLTSNRQSVCTIDFLKIHAVAAGTCSITATVDGNQIYSQATPVTRTFTVLDNKAGSSNPPKETIQPETSLAAASYDPSHSDVDNFSTVIQSSSADHLAHTLVKLSIAPGTTDSPSVFLISEFSSDKESLAGYFVFRIKAIASDGTAVTSLKKKVEINIPAGSIDSKPSWSLDGKSWYNLIRVENKVLPSDMQAGFFVEKDGRITILSNYLMIFGNKKSQLPLKISTRALSMSQGSQVQILANGGSGADAISSAISIYVQQKSVGR